MKTLILLLLALAITACAYTPPKTLDGSVNYAERVMSRGGTDHADADHEHVDGDSGN